MSAAAGLILAIAVPTGAADASPMDSAFTAPPGVARSPRPEGNASHAAARLQELIRQAQSLEVRGNDAQALPLRLQILAIIEKTLGPEHPDTAQSLNDLGRNYIKQGQFSNAEPLLNRSLVIRAKVRGPDHAETASSLNSLAELYWYQGRYDEAEPLARRSLAIREKALGMNHPATAESASVLAALYAYKGKGDKAEELYRRSLAIRETTLGMNHPATADGISDLAVFYDIQGRYREAEVLSRTCLAIREKILGPDHPDTAASLANLAGLLVTQSRYDEAEPLLKRSIAIREKVLGEVHPDTASSLHSLANLYISQGRYGEAEPLYKRSLAIREQSLGPEHPYTSVSLSRLASLYQYQGRYGESEALFRRALSIDEKTLGPEHSSTGASLNNLALLYKEQGRTSEAEALYTRALAIAETVLGPSHPETAASLNNLAQLYVDRGRYSEAEPLFRRSLAIREKALGAEHPATAIGLNNLAALLVSQGRFGDAEPLYTRSLAIIEKALGSEHPDTANSLNNLAALYVKQGRHREAELLYRRSLSIRERALGPQHPDTAISLDNLAQLCSAQGRHSEAETLFKRALAIREKALGPDHPSTAISLHNLAEAHADQGQLLQAEPLYKRSLAISERVQGPEHRATATSLSSLAVLYASQRRYSEADPLFRRSLAIREKVLGSEHPDTALSLNILALADLEQNRPDAAAPLLARLNRSQANWLRRELPLQPRELRMALLDAQPDALATTFALLDQDLSSAPLALETRLNRQGLLAEIEQRQRLLLGSSPQTRQLAERLAGLDRQLGSITLTPTQREQLRSQRQQLESDLNRLLPALRIEPVSNQQVAAALRSLAPQGLLVEYQKYRPLQRHTANGKPAGDSSTWGDPRYLALLLHPDGRIAAVPLGPAAPIDRAIALALQATTSQQSDADARYSDLSALLLNPLLPHLQGVRELFLSPDGGLHRLPFAALPAPGSGGLLLNQVFQLRLLTTGRELLRLQQPAPPGSTAVLIANPNYNRAGRPAATATPQAAVTPTDPAAASQPSSTRRGNANGSNPALPSTTAERQLRSADLSANKIWPPLPATAEEARSLAPLLAIPSPVTASAATAPLVLQQNAPRILHIATHGFFFKEQPAPPANPLSAASGSELPAAPRREDPLLRSGLVLAGANHPDADPTDDGYLTAAEVTGINLQGTQLVTLSACESGLGDLQNGEGVYGLQRSLTVAGARSTLLSLWSVEDNATRAFMQAFYSRLLNGEGRADALARTQDDFRHHPNPFFRTPFVWAAFQLTGDWRPISSGR